MKKVPGPYFMYEKYKGVYWYGRARRGGVATVDQRGGER